MTRPKTDIFERWHTKVDWQPLPACSSWLGLSYTPKDQPENRRVGRIGFGKNKKLYAHKIMWAKEGNEYKDHIYPIVCENWLCMQYQHWGRIIENTLNLGVPNLTREQATLLREGLGRRSRADGTNLRVVGKSKRQLRALAAHEGEEAMSTTTIKSYPDDARYPQRVATILSLFHTSPTIREVMMDTDEYLGVEDFEIFEELEPLYKKQGMILPTLNTTKKCLDFMEETGSLLVYAWDDGTLFYRHPDQPHPDPEAPLRSSVGEGNTREEKA